MGGEKGPCHAAHCESVQCEGLRRRAAVGNVRDGEVSVPLPCCASKDPDRQEPFPIAGPERMYGVPAHCLSGRTYFGICTHLSLDGERVSDWLEAGRRLAEGVLGISSSLGPFQRVPTWCHLVRPGKQGSEMVRRHVEDCAIAGRIVRIDASDGPGSQK
ncbi:hypothetical protein BDP81DRAFT_26422 [Colletotrichum phormii]|uniref:Uncharacterized protein n=1 Tax=Colletotrichum phormii TaxID=359342 RepID=A0AAI9ZRC1_9PEZI|nr:uncharacterized protein BDP81DRAFT_26422 [Colletotrichum phormii]KAK1636673.1 hypothetical protein BDP81DRAFT_26422 [Colletotrichum phormii]